MDPFDLKVVLQQLNRGINHPLHGSQTLFAYTEFKGVHLLKSPRFSKSGRKSGWTPLIFTFCKCRFSTVSFSN